MSGGRVSRRTLLTGGGGALALLAGAVALGDHEVNRHPSWHARIFGCGSTPAIPASSYDVHTGTYASAAMGTEVPWTVAVPNDLRSGERVPLVLVLPGRGGSPADMVSAVGLPGWASLAGLRLCLASPGGVGATYYHPRSNGTNCLAWVADEFVPLVERRFAGSGGSQARRAVYGSSMGGFGALLVGLKRPDLACAVVASSPAVFPSYHAAVTGHADTFDSAADWETWGFWDEAASLTIPARLDCGNGDPLEPTTKTLLSRIPGAVGGTSAGCHDNGFWRRAAATQLQFLDHHLTA